MTYQKSVFSEDGKVVIEVEAGRGYRNNKFLKDIFLTCIMPNAEYLVIAVSILYYNSDDLKTIFKFLEIL